MRTFCLAILLAGSAFGACTATVTNPTAASTVSGLINLTMTYSGCPSAYQAKWQIDDNFPAQGPQNLTGTVSGPTFTYLNYNTGWVTDGIFNIRVLLYDATGALLATSPDINFTISNFSTGTIGVTSPASFFSQPSIIGTVTFSWSTTYSQTADLENLTWSVDGQEFAASSNYSPSHTFDTTTLINGLHSFVMKAECVSNSAGPCGTIGSVNLGGTMPRIFLSAMLNVNNTVQTRGVQPNASEINLTTTGGTSTFSLNAVLSNTDGTTSSGTFNLTLEHACLVADAIQTQLPFRCTSGNAYPGTALEGGPYVSLSSGTLTSGTPVTITALAAGESYLTITDTVSGRVAYVPISVKPTQAIYHFGSCGTIYSAYTPTGNCPSSIITSFQTAPNTDAAMQTGTLKVGATGIETQWWDDPGAGNAANFTNFNSGGTPWLTHWQTNYQMPINNLLTSLPGLSLVLTNGNMFDSPQALIEAQLGPSATTWTQDPFPYAIAQIQATNRVALAYNRDECENGYDSFNLIYSCKTSDGSCPKIVVKGGKAMVYPPTAGSYPADDVYGGNFRWGTPSGILVRNATTAGFNGTVTPHCLYHALWNTTIEAGSSNVSQARAISSVTTGSPTTIVATGHYQTNGSQTYNLESTVSIYGCTGALGTALNGIGVAVPTSITGTGPTTIVIPINTTGLSGSCAAGFISPGPCADPSTGAAVEDSWTFGTSAADGTYTSATDANIEILGLGGNYNGYSYDGSLPAPNNMFSYPSGKIRSAGVHEACPASAAQDIITSIYFNSLSGPGATNALADFNMYYENWPVRAIKTEFPWGLSGIDYWNGIYQRKWGNYHQYLANGAYWQGENQGYVYVPQQVPQGLLNGILGMSFVMGGLNPSISTISGSTLTTTSPHGIGLPGGTFFNYYKAVVSGSTDSTMNGEWYVYPIGASTLRMYSKTAIGCAQSGALGTLTLRGSSYAITAGYSQTQVSTGLPHDLTPGELITISGAGAGCANATWAFLGWASYPPAGG